MLVRLKDASWFYSGYFSSFEFAIEKTSHMIWQQNIAKEDCIK